MRGPMARMCLGVGRDRLKECWFQRAEAGHCPGHNDDRIRQ
jgi:hypothetical protein